ncbi:MAG: ABC transporter permease, partial [Gemmatimonadetes bacterium]|nr:ABC transporter permease [Gemmatimonadota bacterium]
MNANRAAAALSRWQRLRASDLFYSFRRSPTTIIATIVTLVFVAGAVFAPILAPHTPFVPSSI